MEKNHPVSELMAETIEKIDLIDQMVQAAGGGGADVHARPLPDGLQSLQDLNLRGPVLMFHRGGVFLFQLIHF